MPTEGNVSLLPALLRTVKDLSGQLVGQQILWKSGPGVWCTGEVVGFTVQGKESGGTTFTLVRTCPCHLPGRMILPSDVVKFPEA